MSNLIRTTTKRAKSHLLKHKKKVFGKTTNFSRSSNGILALHQTIGNRGVQRLFDSGFIQGKLTVGAPNDKYEQEADRVADEVMRMPEPQVQRQREEEEEEEMIQTKPIGDQITPLVQRQVEPEEEEEETLQAKAESQTPDLTPNVESKINALQGGGQPLSKETRNFFEPRFGKDFSSVKIHTDSNANHLARSVNARAFTKGSDIVFGGGEYSPGSQGGKRLLGHELTHVVQQRSLSHLQSHVITKKAEEENDKEFLQTKKGSGQTLVQRDLATSFPAIPDPAQDALSDKKVSKAITFNKRRYNTVGTRLIQDLVGTTPTGTWAEADIRAIVAIQEKYGLVKDGKVGTKTFRFLDTGVKNKRLPKTDANCLTALRIKQRSENIMPRVNGATMTRTFTMKAQFPRYCGCGNFEYRQFIRGHFKVTRGGVTHDQGNWFNTLPEGRLNAAWQEDGHTGGTALNYGHRTQPVEYINRYINDAGTVNMANGCRYQGEDTPGGNYSGWIGFPSPTTGDIFNININFRGEIRRNGRVVRSNHWSALQRRFTLP